MLTSNAYKIMFQPAHVFSIRFINNLRFNNFFINPLQKIKKPKIFENWKCL